MHGSGGSRNPLEALPDSGSIGYGSLWRAGSFPYGGEETNSGRADAYEVAAYMRVKAPLASGLEAWIYVDARGKPPAA